MEPSGAGLLVDNPLGEVICGSPVLGLLRTPELEVICPVENKPATVPPEVAVVWVVPIGGTAKVPGVVGVKTFIGLIPGAVGVVGVVPPGVITPVAVANVSVTGFFIALMVCRICVTLAQRSRPMAPKSFSYCSKESGGKRVLSNTPGQCF